MKKTSTCKLRNELNELLQHDDCDPLRWRQVAENRLLLVQDIMELINICGHDEMKLKRHLTDAVQMDRLKERGVIDLEYHAALLQAYGIVLCKSELELSCLIYNGFNIPLLRIIYGHGNAESIYVRMNRIKTKISGHNALMNSDRVKITQACG